MSRLFTYCLAAACCWSLGHAAVAAEEKPTASPELVDVFVAGTEGYHTFRIPAIVATKKGTLLAFCEGRKTGQGDHGDLDLLLKRSEDGGKTWGPLQLVYEEGDEKKVTIGNPCPVVDEETGAIWLPFNRNNNDCLVTHSTDDGKTWSAPKNITKEVKEDNWNWYAMGPGNGIQLTRGKHKGRLVIPCDHRVKGEQTDWSHAGRSHVIYSDDHGESWKLGGIIPSFAMNECAVAELEDGSLLMNMRSYRGKLCRAVAISKDGGETWSEAVDAPELIDPVCQGTLIRYTWADDGKSRLLFCNAASKGRDKLTVRLSEDEGKTWPISREIYKNSAAYSNLVALPNKNIGLLFERDGYTKISFTEFDLKWLSAGNEQ